MCPCKLRVLFPAAEVSPPDICAALAKLAAKVNTLQGRNIAESMTAPRLRMSGKGPQF